MNGKFVRLLPLIALVGFGLTHSVGAEAQRERIRIDAGWKFHLGDIGATPGRPISAWKWKRGDAGETPPGLDASGWADAKPGEDTFHGKSGYAWYLAELPSVSEAKRVLHFESVDDNATVYLNGKLVATHEGWNDPFDVELDPSWNASGPNVLAVLVQNNAGAGGIGAASLQINPGYVDEGPAAPTYDDSSWRGVHLPHDFVVEGEFTPTADASHGSLKTDVGWYRKTFDSPASDKGKRIWLDFDGIYRNSRIWLNGKLVGGAKSGYIGVRCDLTNALNYGGKNTLVVRADARAQEGWWYEGGGIYRHVWMTKTQPLHITPDSVFVVSEPTADGNANIRVHFGVQNENTELTPSFVTDIIGPKGKKVATLEQKFDAQPGQVVGTQAEFKIPNAKLWSIENPQLYKAVNRIVVKGKTIDSVTTNFGIRSIRFDAQKGFFLNGKPVKIQGTCNHQDFAGVGIAMPDSLQEWRIRKLKAMGSNAYRCSHNPPTPELLDACDRLGMIVMDETRHLGDALGPKTSTGTKYDDLSELKALIFRDRNHPSVIIWSMANEEPLQGTEEGGKMFAAMKKVTLDIDPTRPVSSAMNGGYGGGISLVEDLQGVNYNLWAYDDHHRKFPNQPMFGSETASEVGTRGEYANDKIKGYVSAYSVNAPPWAQTSEVAWKALGEREFMAGGFVWTGFDYKGEPTPYEWPCINSHFGIMDEAGFPKDAYYYYQAWWGDKPVAHILPHWNWPGREGQPIDVWVHGNADKYDLLLNGKSLGMKDMPRLGHLEWKVPYTSGKLEAKGYRNGKLIVSDIVETTDAATQIRLTTTRKQLIADGEDVTMVEVALLDFKGRVVPFADNEVTFDITGAAHVGGVGNGDPSSHEPDKASKRKAFHGLCLVVVQANEKGGPITLTASANGLKSATMALSAK